MQVLQKIVESSNFHTRDPKGKTREISNLFWRDYQDQSPAKLLGNPHKNFVLS